MEEEETVVWSCWQQLQADLEALAKDVKKNTLKSNVSAGVRVRKGLRECRAQLGAMIKATLEADKAVVEKRKAENAAKKQDK